MEPYSTIVKFVEDVEEFDEIWETLRNTILEKIDSNVVFKAANNLPLKSGGYKSVRHHIRSMARREGQHADVQ